MNKRIWVTGGTGLVGRAFNHIKDRYPDREFFLSGSKDCDLTSIPQICDYIKRNNIDSIVHLAALAGGVEYSRTYPATLLRDNVLMNLLVVEGARLCGVSKVVMSMSTGMYPPDAPNPIKEESIHDGPPHESNYSYSFAKRLVEPTIRAYRSEYKMNLIGLVPNGMFGEFSDYRFDRSIMLPALIRRFYESRSGGEPLVIWGDGSPLREYTYADDVARAYMWCLDNYNDPQILHIGNTEEYSVKDMALMVAELLSIDPKRLTFDSSKPAGIHRKATDNSKFVTMSDFKYTPFRVGLERTIKWFCEHYHESDKVRL